MLVSPCGAADELKVLDTKDKVNCNLRIYEEYCFNMIKVEAYMVNNP
jgi:hypothetical protein